MGRELKRVALDFDYPLNKTWDGYLNPHYKKCPECENGYTQAGKRLQDLVRLIMISGSDSLRGKNHRYFDHICAFVGGFDSVPSKDMADLTAGLAGRVCSQPFGHDAGDEWAAAKKIIEAAGCDEKWGVCTHCDGDAIDPEAKEAYEGWQEHEPPSGEGFQLWETTSEGSPCTPVFKSLEELCEYCERERVAVFGGQTATKEEWMKMLDDGVVYYKVGNIIFI